MYLVTGATGHVGGPLVRQLHEQAHGVRALVRDASRAASLPAGIELAVMDPEDIARVAVAALTTTVTPARGTSSPARRP
jgi:uncharacterized protein YbjT (DUF2867 family)